MNDQLQHPNPSGILVASCADVRPESAVIDRPKWLERGYQSIAVSVTKSGSAGVLPMSDDERASAKQRETARQPFGFQAPEPKRKKARKR